MQAVIVHIRSTTGKFSVCTATSATSISGLLISSSSPCSALHLSSVQVQFWGFPSSIAIVKIHASPDAVDHLLCLDHSLSPFRGYLVKPLGATS